MNEQIKQIKAELRQKLGDDYEIIIKLKKTKKMRDKTQKEIKEIQDAILSEGIDMSNKELRIQFLKDLRENGFSVIALKEVFGFKSHTNIYHYLKK
jgi:chromosome condensin MukBEF complex kleisin-like MukF subunit